MQMRRLFTLLMLTGAMLLGAAASSNPFAAEAGAQQAPAALPAADAAAPLFRMGQAGGKVAVFTAEAETPAVVYDVYLANLPAADRIALQQGVPVYSAQTLRRLIEDYTS